MNKPYLLASPPFDPASGGIKVMYALYGWLLAKGQAAFLNNRIDVPAIGIYPEIYHGNDMMAQKVIRYILQKPGMMSTPDEFGVPKPGPVAFDPTDEIYVFSKVYDEWESKDDHVLFLPAIDLHTFKDLGIKRDKTAFFVGKGVNRGKHPEGAIELTRRMGYDQEELAGFLNACSVLYVYDPVSAIMECARLCGTPVIYWGGMPKQQFELYEPGMNGISYEQEAQKELDTQPFRMHYKSLIRTFEQKLDFFITQTQA